MLESISIIKEKSKFGKIDRVTNANEILIKDLFNKETGPDVYMNLRITINLTGQQGTIYATFGKSGKLKCRIDGEGLDLNDENVKENILNSDVELKYKKNMMKAKKNKFK